MSLSSRNVTGALPCGQTTRAFFQSSSVHGGLSGSSAALRSISSSVIASRRAQSVRLFILLACFSDTRVIRSSVISSCPSGADNPAAFAPPRVCNLDDRITEPSDRPIPPLAVIASQILGRDETGGKDRDRIDKVDAVLEDVGLTLGFVPFEIHP